jgi:DNA-binding NarL/FixJ family response regulator
MLVRFHLGGGSCSPLAYAEENPMIDVVIADDHRLVRQGISALLARAEEIDVVGEAADGREALDLVASLDPDVLVLDISMPGMNGFQALTALDSGQNGPGPPVIFLSMHEDRALVLRALAAGASGYVLKRSAPAELVAAISAVDGGDRYICAALRDKLPRRYLDGRPN